MSGWWSWALTLIGVSGVLPRGPQGVVGLRRYSRLAVAASVYPCPHGFGCFHVRTERRVK